MLAQESEHSIYYIQTIWNIQICNFIKHSSLATSSSVLEAML